MNPISRLVWSLFAAGLVVGCSGRSRPPALQPEPPVTASVRIRPQFDDGGQYPLDGLRVLVDGQQVAAAVVAGDSGPTLEVQVAFGERRIVVQDPLLAAGAAVANAAAPQAGAATAVIDLPIMLQSKDNLADVALAIEAANGGLVGATTTAFPLTVRGAGGSTLALDAVTTVEIGPADGEAERDVTTLFVLDDDDVVRCTDVPAFLALATALPNGCTVFLTGNGADGRSVEAEATVRFGSFDVDLTFQAPPSAPGLGLASLPVSLRLIGTDYEATGSTDAGGRVVLGPIPAGTWQLRSDTTLPSGAVYVVNATVFVLGDVFATVTPRTTQDVIAGVPGITLTGPTPLLPEAPDAQRLAAVAAAAAAAAMTSPDGGDTGTAITATAGLRDVRVTQTASVPVAAGTSRVQLRYQVATAEYPFYVLSQSVYNDNWEVFVRTQSGAELFSISRNVNSQVSVEPLWRTSGDTGQIVETLDVAALTATAGTELVLVVTATNIGDSALPTTVTAGIEVAGFEIEALKLDEVTTLSSRAQLEQQRVSIPLAGETNVAQRSFTVELAGVTATTSIDNVRVELVDLATETVVAVVVDQPPGGLVELAAPDRLRVQVTNSSLNPSTIGGQSPPPAERIAYRCIVRATVDGTSVEAEKRSKPLFALWRMPPGFARIGTRDLGGDDWCARSTFVFMSVHAGKLTRINDISGEHARNIGHDSHRCGTDIDMFQFGVAGNVTSGLANYKAIAAVAAWFQAQRSGFGELLPLTEVVNIRSARGLPKPAGPAGQSALPGGWSQQLLQEGTLQVGSTTLDLGIGTWSDSSGKMRFDNVHNDHTHVTLVKP
jgi:hypothetical protein